MSFVGRLMNPLISNEIPILPNKSKIYPFFLFQEIEEIQNQNPWKMIKGEPIPLPMAEQILYPRFKNAVLFAAQRV